MVGTAASMPASRFIRVSFAVTGATVLIAAILLITPAAWLGRMGYPLALALFGTASAAVALAIVATLSKGGAQSAGVAALVVGLNVVVTLVVVVFLFSFRMGA